jgi:hypothetical protein
MVSGVPTRTLALRFPVLLSLSQILRRFFFPIHITLIAYQSSSAKPTYQFHLVLCRSRRTLRAQPSNPHGRHRPPLRFISRSLLSLYSLGASVYSVTA